VVKSLQMPVAGANRAWAFGNQGDIMKTIIKVSLLIFAALCPLATTASEDSTVADFMAGYCRCMSEKMSVLPDSEIVQLQHELADHVPRAAEAVKKGQRPPETPPTLKQFMASTKSCALD
jgi:hypothetical protein